MASNRFNWKRVQDVKKVTTTVAEAAIDSEIKGHPKRKVIDYVPGNNCLFAVLSCGHRIKMFSKHEDPRKDFTCVNCTIDKQTAVQHIRNLRPISILHLASLTDLPYDHLRTLLYEGGIEYANSEYANKIMIPAASVISYLSKIDILKGLIVDVLGGLDGICKKCTR